jgi:molecular chaperone GrpE
MLQQDNKNQQQEDSTNSNDFVEKPNQQKSDEQNQVSDFEKENAELKQKLEETNDKLLRLAAELENVRRRSKEEIEKTAKYAVSNFVSDLVLIVENFFLAADNAPQNEIDKNPQVKNFADAILMTRKELVKILEKNQVKRIFPLDEKFDHNFHEAIAQVESEKEEAIVVQVIQAGYSIADRLIRPALVSVSKGTDSK